MEQSVKIGLTDTEMEAEIARMQVETRLMLDEIKAERKRGDLAWREAERLSAANSKMLDEIGEILRAARD